MSAQDDLNAAALAYAASLGWVHPDPPPPPPPPPPPTPVYLFDGRAVTQKTLPTTAGLAPGSVTQTPPNPLPVWDGYLYQGADVTVVDDPRFGKAYRLAPAAGHHNPYNSGAPAGATSAVLNKVRPLKQGDVCWYADAFWIDSLTPGFPSWGEFLSLGYQVILYSNVSLGPRASAAGQSNVWAVSQNAGLVTGSTPAVAYTQPLKPVTLKAWADWVIGYYPSTGADGWLEVHYRPQGGSWSQPWRKDGPTLEYRNATGTPDPGSQLNDSTRLYFGWWNGAQTPAPTGDVLARGLSRHPTLADAVASLG